MISKTSPFSTKIAVKATLIMGNPLCFHVPFPDTLVLTIPTYVNDEFSRVSFAESFIASQRQF